MTGTQTGRFAALKAPLYRRYWLGSIGSVGATQLVMMAMSWLVFALSGSPADLAMLGVAASLPTIIVVLVGGVVADRLDRRRIMMVTAPLSALLMATLALLDAGGAVEVWHVWAIAALFATVAGFDWPAWQSLFPLLIERRYMVSAVSLNAMLWQGSRMVMPGVGGFIIAVFSTAAVFGIAAAGFLIMFAVIASLRVRATARSSHNALRAFAEGVRFIAGNRLFYVLIPLSYTVMFFSMSYLQIMPLFTERLGVGADAFGLLIAASGLGSVAGTLGTASLQGSPRLGPIMLGSAIAAATIQLVFCAVTKWYAGAAWAYAAAALCVSATAALTSVFLIASMSVLQLAVPEPLRGRVMSIHGITFSMIALGALFSGTVAEYSGPSAAVAIGAAVVIAANVGVWMLQPRIRGLRGDSLRGDTVATA